MAHQSRRRLPAGILMNNPMPDHLKISLGDNPSPEMLHEIFPKILENRKNRIRILKRLLTEKPGEAEKISKILALEQTKLEQAEAWAKQSDMLPHY
jgi:hypothetical protein